jgi:integrase/recombinase XerD
MKNVGKKMISMKRRISVEDELVFFRDLDLINERQKVWILLAALAGLREAEIARLKYKDILNANGSLKSRFVHHRGKMRTKMPVTLPKFLRKALEDFIGGQNPNRRPKYLFPGRKGKHINTQTPYKAWVRYQEKIYGEIRYSFHDLRRMAVTRFFEATGSLEDTRKFARHKKATITELYILLDDEDYGLKSVLDDQIKREGYV